MDDSQLPESIAAFFTRSGLTLDDYLECQTFLSQRYHNKLLYPSTCQGFCSMTIFVNNELVVQFRPYKYRLDLQVTDTARSVYEDYAPDTRYVTTLQLSGLIVYEMGRIGGISYKDHVASSQSTSNRSQLCKDLAVFVAQSWHNRTVSEQLPRGRVGKSIVSRLKSLVTDLPLRFQARARYTLQHIDRIEGLPWVLTHGDIVAGNIMVDPSTGSLTGMVDWAEAERLPFGICFYGLEELLGVMTSTGFQYYADADALRQCFWAELENQIPALRASALKSTVMLSRDLGVLLWHGIAFDNGNINRVVQEGRDVEEIHRLDAFLDLDVEIQDWDLTSKI